MRYDATEERQDQISEDVDLPVVGQDKVSSTLFLYSDMKHVLDKNIRLLHKADKNPASQTLKAKPKKATKAQGSAAKQSPEHLKTEPTNQEEDPTHLVSGSFALQGLQMRDEHLTGNVDDNISIKQKKQYLLQLMNETEFGYTYSQLEDTKKVFRAEMAVKDANSS